MPATAPPPDAPAAPAAPAKPSSQPAQAAQTTIAVSSMPKGDLTIPPPKPGSARARLSADLHKRFDDGEPTPPAPAPKPADAPKGPDSTVTPKDGSGSDSPEPPKPGEAEPAKPGEAGAPPADKGKTKGQSPWKLLDEQKARSLTLERENAELRKRVPSEEQQQTQAKEIDAIRAQNKAMADDLRFYYAERYDPDVTKADADYQAGWKRAMKDISEIPFTDPNSGEPRAVTMQDMLELVNMPLGTAREIADKVFGAFADDVMSHRKEIRALFETKAAKLEEVKKNGAERERARQAEFKNRTGAAAKFIADTYQAEVAAALEHPQHGQYFKPREGDDDWNGRLERGFKFVDGAYSQNALDPKLNAEQRREVVAKHAAVRNRAAAFSALRFDNERLQAKLKAAEEKLKGYQESAPPAGGRAPDSTPASAPHGMAGLKASLRGIAKGA